MARKLTPANLVARVRAFMAEADELRQRATLGDFAARTRRSALLSSVMAAQHDLENARALAPQQKEA